MKVGGEFFNERFDDLRGQDGHGQVPNDVLMVLSERQPVGSRCSFQSPTTSLNGLWTTGLVRVGHLACHVRALTFKLGVVFDRYRSYLPEQTGPPVGPFNATQASFPAVDNLITWN